MVPFITNGQFWRVVRVSPGDPRLIDRTNNLRLAVTDSLSQMIYVSDAVRPPMLDRVVLHEVSHAISAADGTTARLRAFLPPSYWVPVEEWGVGMVERIAIEAIDITSHILGRPVCIGGFCHDKY